MHHEKKYTQREQDLTLSKTNVMTAEQKMKFSIRIYLVNAIWSHLLKKSLKENFIFSALDIVG